MAYGLYIFHTGLLQLALVLGAEPVIHDVATLGLALCALAATFLMASLSWRYLEAPLIRRGQERYRYAAAAQTSAVGQATQRTL